MKTLRGSKAITNVGQSREWKGARGGLHSQEHLICWLIFVEASIIEQINTDVYVTIDFYREIKSIPLLFC